MRWISLLIIVLFVGCNSCFPTSSEPPAIQAVAAPVVSIVDLQNDIAASEYSILTAIELLPKEVITKDDVRATVKEEIEPVLAELKKLNEPKVAKAPVVESKPIVIPGPIVTEIQETVVKSIAPMKPVETKVVQNLVNSTGYYHEPDNYRSQWDYPGDIDSHLLLEHGEAIVGTKEEKEKLHDKLHNAAKARTIVQAPVYQQPAYSVRSNCPGGVCPTPQTRTVRGWGIFRR